jgi:hypothetical protein
MTSKTVLDVDGEEIDWTTLCQWSKMSEQFQSASHLADPSPEKTIAPQIMSCEKYFGASRVTVEQGSIPIVFSFSYLVNHRHLFMARSHLSLQKPDMRDTLCRN